MTGGNRFTKPVKVVVFTRQGVKYTRVLLGIKMLKFVVCPVGVFSEVSLAETAANRAHNLQLSPGLKEHVCYPASIREK